MSDQGTRISASPSTSQRNRMMMRATRLIVELGLWEIIAAVATVSRVPHAGLQRPSWNGMRRGSGEYGRRLVLLQRSDAVGNVAVINVHRINLTEAIERRVGLAGRVQRHRQVVAQRQHCFLIEPRHFKGPLIPQRRNL